MNVPRQTAARVHHFAAAGALFEVVDVAVT